MAPVAILVCIFFILRNDPKISTDTDIPVRNGADGSWSSFALRVGDPEQLVRVLPSTMGQSTWVVTPLGCLPGEPGSNTSLACAQSRGGLFLPFQSSSWNFLGNYSLEIDFNLGFEDGVGTYGLDTVALDFSGSNGPPSGPTLSSQMVTAIATNDYYIGLFGLSDHGTNLTNSTDPHPSFLSTLMTESLIPSRSWAYTAGASYRKSIILLG